MCKDNTNKGDENMDFKKFLKDNKFKVRKLAEKNTKRNSNGDTVIKKMILGALNLNGIKNMKHI